MRRKGREKFRAFDLAEDIQLAGSEHPASAEADRLNGTLLKCPGCRLKFPFSAANHPLEQKRFPPIGGTGDSRLVLVTHCPQCEGWVSIN